MSLFDEMREAHDLQAFGALNILYLLTEVFIQADHDTFTRQEVLEKIDCVRAMAAPSRVQVEYRDLSDIVEQELARESEPKLDSDVDKRRRVQ